jgi:hypothetical protein
MLLAHQLPVPVNTGEYRVPMAASVFFHLQQD